MSDLIETRLALLESRWKATSALVHCLLPAIDPARRPVVLRQFQQYCSATERETNAQPKAPEYQQHLQVLADAYRTLEGALQRVEEYEARQAAKRSGVAGGPKTDR